MEDKVVVGLDIGTTNVCAVVGQMNAQGMLEILGSGRAESTGVAKGVVLNVTKTVDAVNKVVEQAGNQAQYDIGAVVVGITGNDIRCLRRRGNHTRDTPGSEVLVSDIERLISNIAREPLAPGNDVMHVLAQEYKVDSWDNIYDPVGMTGTKLEADFQVITSPTLALENTRKCIERAHLELDALVLAPLAAALAVITEDEKEAGVALVDIGGGTTDVVIFYKNIVRHVAIIPVAGNHITSDLQSGCSLMPGQAELLKIKYGSAIQSHMDLHAVVSVPGMKGRMPKDISLKNASIIIEERLKEIAALVAAEINRAGYDSKLSGGIVLTGGTAQFENIEDLFARVTGRDVRVGAPNIHFGRGKFEVAENPIFATAVGLVWRGFHSLDAREDEYRSIKESATPPGVTPVLPYQQHLANTNANGHRKPEKTEKAPQPVKEEKTPSRVRFFDFLKNVVLNDEVGDKDRYQ